MSGYSGYVNSPGARPAAAARLALSAKNFGKLQKQRQAAPPVGSGLWPTINRIVGQLGNGQTDAQIGSTAQGMLDPIIAAITSNVSRQAKQASDSIAGNSASLASELGKLDYAKPYDTATSQQAAVDAALREALAGGGAALANDLQSRLGVIADPTVAAAAGNVGATGTAAGATELARGSANLGSLIAGRASATSYGAKMPGIAKLAGLQDIAGVNANAVNTIGDQTAQVTGQLPSIVQALRNERSGLRGDKASMVANLFTTLSGQEIDKSSLKERTYNDSVQASIAATNAALRAEGLRLTAQAQQNALDAKIAAGAKPNASLSRAYGFIVDSSGAAIVDAHGKRIPVAKTSTADVPPWQSGGAGPKALRYDPATAKPTGSDIAGFAHDYLGIPYKWGGNDPKTGIDCSAFVQQVYARVGIKLPRTTYDQVKAGTAVDLNQLRPGDAIFTRPGKNGPEHVGLYVGNGMVQESPHTGDVNKVVSLSDYLSGGFVAARRYTR